MSLCSTPNVAQARTVPQQIRLLVLSAAAANATLHTPPRLLHTLPAICLPVHLAVHLPTGQLTPKPNLEAVRLSQPSPANGF